MPTGQPTDGRVVAAFCRNRPDPHWGDLPWQPPGWTLTWPPRGRCHQRIGRRAGWLPRLVHGLAVLVRRSRAQFLLLCQSYTIARCWCRLAEVATGSTYTEGAAGPSRQAPRTTMAEPFEHLLDQTTQSFRALLERSWTLLVARTPPDDAAAITVACDLQRQLITTGTAWLALVEQVRALEQAATARLDAPPEAMVGLPDPAALAPLPRPTGQAPSAAASLAASAPTPRRAPHHRRSARRPRRGRFRGSRRPAPFQLAATGPAVHDPLDALPAP